MNDKPVRKRHLWAICEGGRICLGYAIRRTKARTQMMFLRDAWDNHQTWEHAEEMGYSCRKVTVKEGWE